MAGPELAHLELLADFDALVAALRAWTKASHDWPPTRRARALIERLFHRAEALRVRLDAPLVVATLGGTGTGKSTLINAIVGDDVTREGRERPTTMRPVMICRRDITPALLGIRDEAVEVVHRDLPALAGLVLIDCPDPDTTEDEEGASTNLSRLRELLPHCDVLLVTTTQQKYRSARVAAELSSAASGARLVFVQTHADIEDDVRGDWARVLAGEYDAGDIFLVDSVAALAETRAGRRPEGDFGRLLDLLTRDLAGTASHRIRRANFLDLVQETLAACHETMRARLPQVAELERAITDARTKLAEQMATRVRAELLASRRIWEQRLVAEIAGRWGFSPFSLVLRAYLGLGSVVSGAALARVRSSAQLAVWGSFEAARRLRSRGLRGRAESAIERGAAGWEPAELKTAAIIVSGYATEAGMAYDDAPRSLPREAEEAAAGFMGQASRDVQNLVSTLATRNSRLGTRLLYETPLIMLVGLLLLRFGKNFFVDSWLAPILGWRDASEPILGVEFYLGAAVVLGSACAALLWFFTARLRRGLDGEVAELAAGWNGATMVNGLFFKLEEACRAIRRDVRALDELERQVSGMRSRVTQPMPRVGHRHDHATTRHHTAGPSPRDP